MIRGLVRSEKGQTAVEYLLMTALVVGLALTFFKKLEDYLIKNPNGLISKPLNAYKLMLTGQGSQGQAYRTFYVRKIKK